MCASVSEERREREKRNIKKPFSTGTNYTHCARTYTKRYVNANAIGVLLIEERTGKGE
jgi:hypothetical protein